MQCNAIWLIVLAGYIEKLCWTYKLVGLRNMLLEWNSFLCRRITTAAKWAIEGFYLLMLSVSERTAHLEMQIWSLHWVLFNRNCDFYKNKWFFLYLCEKVPFGILLMQVHMNSVFVQLEWDIWVWLFQSC